MIRVYHRKEPTFLDDGAPAYQRSDFVLAATVQTDDLDRAYYLTNSVEHYWPENIDVTAEKPPAGMKGWRSTSCGDLLEKNDVFHAVATFGFRTVALEEALAKAN